MEEKDDEQEKHWINDRVIAPLPIISNFAHNPRMGSPHYGYWPFASLEIAQAFCYVRLPIFTSMIRELLMVDFSEGRDGDSIPSAKALLNDICQSDLPFAMDRRFPAKDVFICIDRPPIMESIATLQTVLSTPSYDRKTASISQFFSALTRLSRLISEDSQRELALYCRDRFEQLFSLHWNPNFVA